MRALKFPLTLVTTLFLLYSAFRGVAFGVVANFGEVIARKDLLATELQVTLLTMLMPVMSFSSIWWGRLLQGRDQRPWLGVMGLFGFGVLSTGFWMMSITHMFSIHLLYYTVFAVMIPAQNRVLQQHLRPEKQGSLFGFAQGVRMGVAALTTFFGGIWMDHVAHGYHHLYAIAGGTGILATIALIMIPPGKTESTPPQRHTGGWWTGPFHETVRLLKRRPDFLRFELAFLLYGIAFMMTLPVVPIYMVNDLLLDYSTIGFARGALYQLILIVALPFFGRLFDRSTPYFVASWVFALLALYPTLLVAAKGVEPALRMPVLYSAFVVYGIAFAGVSIVWTISSLRFAGANEDAGVYQSVHMAFVGVRGLFAPLMGYFAMEIIGRQGALLVSALFFASAGVAMAVLHRRDGRLLHLPR
ncbi:MFS transporter [bacterium]|nr:MFS transporter [bacterium]